MSLYEYRQVAGAGTATFATQDIPRGTVIISEEPLLAMLSEEGAENPFEIWTTFQSLSDERKTTFRSLFHSPYLLDNSRVRMQNLLGKENLAATGWTADLEEIAVVAAKYYTNAFDAHDEAPIDQAVFAQQSRLNHMCTNNCFQDSGPTGRQNMVAQRDIQKGEELTCSYIGVYASQVIRKQRLVPYGFECACPLCEMEVYLNAHPDIQIVKFSTKLDHEAFTDMATFLQVWFHSVQERKTEESRRSAAEALGCDLDDAENAFLVALTLLKHMLAEKHAAVGGKAFDIQPTANNCNVNHKFLVALQGSN